MLVLLLLMFIVERHIIIQPLKQVEYLYGQQKMLRIIR